MNMRRYGNKRILPAAAAAACLAVILSLSIGSGGISPAGAIRALAGQGKETDRVIMLFVRLPRTAAGILAGIGLSLAGLLLQKITGNPLAGPNVTGVSAGAGFAAALGLLLFPGSFRFTSVFAFAGAVLTLGLVVGVSKIGQWDRSTMLLAGIACNALFQALIALLTGIEPDLLYMYHAFSVGSLNGITFDRLMIPAALIAVCLAAVLLLGERIGVMALGDEIAASMGVNVPLMRCCCLCMAAVCIASVVSFAGLIGFVGLMIPNIAKRLNGERMPGLTLLSVFLGTALVLLADLAGRMLFAPSEIETGIMLALIGAPFFFGLLIRERRKRDA